MKTGLYRDPYTSASVVDSIIMYRDDIQFTNISDGTKSNLTDFGIQNKIMGDSIAHYINLHWTNPTDTDHDSTFIFSSTKNDTSTAIKIAAVYKSKTSYRDTLITGVTRYYWLKSVDKNGNVSSYSAVAVDNTSVFASN